MILGYQLAYWTLPVCHTCEDRLTGTKSGKSPKLAFVTRRLAGVLVGVDVVEQMPTTHDFVRMIEVGFGTEERAVRFLKTSSRIKSRVRGQMGAFLISKDVEAFWRIPWGATTAGMKSCSEVASRSHARSG
jgi:hypothetical protein